MNTGLTNPYVYALAIDPHSPTTLYAGGGSGIYKTTNGGNNWNNISAGLVLGVGTIAIDPQNTTTLYAGTWGGAVRVYKSTDGGAHWNAMSTGITNLVVNALVIDPQAPNTLYAGTYGGGVFKSTDGGGNWTAMNSGLTNLSVIALVIDPQAPNTLYAGTYGGGVFKSTDGGGNWTAMNSGLTNLNVEALAIDPQAPNTLYAGTYGGGVYKSTDGEGNWTAMNSGLTNLSVIALAIDPQAPNTLYAGTLGDLFKIIQATETITTPVPPSGTTSGTVGTSYTYSTGGSTSNLGHSVQYFFDWGDGTNSGWLPVGQTSASKSWTSGSTYSVKAQARCATDTSVASAWSGTLSVTISAPETISTPSTPSGPTSGTTGISYTYSTGGSSSNLGHPVEYQFDWKGDGATDLSSWGSATQSRTWNVPDAYNVKARARCTTDTSVVSNWSNSLSVSISIPKISVTPMAYDFGNVKVKRSKTASFVIKNIGKGNLSITSAITGTDESMFTITSGSGSKTIKAGKSLTVKVAFKPTSKRPKTANFEITSNDPVTPTVDIPLSGTGQ